MSYHYRILPHPADVRLEIIASSKKELFEGALKGMASILSQEKGLNNYEVKKQIEVQSLDLNTLLVDFLSEVLAKSDIYHCVFRKIKILKMNDKSILAELEGKKVKRFDEEIKAVTYHGLQIQQNKKGEYEAIILFDI